MIVPRRGRQSPPGETAADGEMNCIVVPVVEDNGEGWDCAAILQSKKIFDQSGQQVDAETNDCTCCNQYQTFHFLSASAFKSPDFTLVRNKVGDTPAHKPDGGLLT